MASATSQAMLQRPTLLNQQVTSSLASGFFHTLPAAPLLLSGRTRYSSAGRNGVCRCGLQPKSSSKDLIQTQPKISPQIADKGPDTTVLYSFAAPLVIGALASADSPAGGYSQASYYTTLGLFVLSAPGLWSLIKRSTKSKIVQKTFVVDGPAKEEAKPLDSVASEIATFFKNNNYSIAGTGEVITFEGNVAPSRGQAAFLTFCAALGLLSIALVLSIAVPDVGEKWYGMTLLSPLAGVYYWRKASRKEKVKVKMVTSDDEVSTDIIVEGDDEEIERFRRELDMREKGKIYVKGLLER
ncbi:hypothetical protein KFL_000190250 [Klebsormidium nitens]|uniref:Cofactor assembly of complex C subunit B n=1 Tax=Klebsormidium nitens TaxID=105231 RepID=A0A1Y1HQD7_KLENI|nr:hypothetical protein KFL_000190250 [Klebsormidium nitens]|eukprot:GAQ78806.1 hypothetical protein KFL_000190250 [Klebsormidium nitens]